MSERTSPERQRRNRTAPDTENEDEGEKTRSESVTPLLRIEDLRKHYVDKQGVAEWVLSKDPGRVRAVDGVSFEVDRGETVGIVGESGCGKSTLARTILGLHEPTDGYIEFAGKDVHEQIASDRKRFARRAQIVFQDPSSCLDPRMTLREIVREPLDIHQVGAKAHRNEKVTELVERVGLSTDQLERYAHEFSGGQRQRIGIARALALDPELIVLDEPTSALDVSVQAQILNLLSELQEEFNLTYLFISHDLSVIRYLCDRVVVMYLGQVAETGPVDAVFERPAHPYTKILLESVPGARNRIGEEAIKSDIPSPRNPPRGCRFHTRCPVVLPPSKYGMEFEQDAWQGIFEYKLRLRSGRLGRERATELAELTDNDGNEETTAKEAVRDSCSIPRVLSDSTAEELLDQSLSALVDGDSEMALKIMNADFESPCEQERPAVVDIDIDTDHRAACLRASDEEGEQ
ncbi:ATP-binding cassette domain-containing protein [Halobacteria archaeon AArc-m2/3/4]|uniref:ATP-binding cassette domain-containing protein n=1 Tax=Natronoglomus mannanivorans TaxID=2979990 RepID=A0AAP3E2X1_9EURY|nr:ATP-binding cassette domain-containing protein [Halobacteria archaeon AArc-xg1-1]MCU4973826.1 ATP-binding cassette domain-containing protein [Halobacteria archaeon AArc-m2/3/4]